MLPSILRRVDELLIVRELNTKLFDDSIYEHELLAALTSPAALAERDYERLELLGTWSSCQTNLSSLIIHR